MYLKTEFEEHGVKYAIDHQSLQILWTLHMVLSLFMALHSELRGCRTST
ncbi:MAG: hypothetical protein ETSY2_51775 [Candidatus Entotheonella gemina]|uniref:Uncharacterized protein n=1 Tax=Candidatus Entotheonella gemina TaxID=1429439 RepID=W4L561_9BACT|nr:MAG: hypothetical protein ETSY2_51775 [Candidatus Entotheonella gemina]